MIRPAPTRTKKAPDGPAIECVKCFPTAFPEYQEWPSLSGREASRSARPGAAGCVSRPIHAYMRDAGYCNYCGQKAAWPQRST